MTALSLVFVERCFTGDMTREDVFIFAYAYGQRNRLCVAPDGYVFEHAVVIPELHSTALCLFMSWVLLFFDWCMSMSVCPSVCCTYIHT